MHKSLVLFMCVFYVQAAYDGESCTKDGQVGKCINIKNCKAALEDIRNRKNLQICSFDSTDPIVCCLDKLEPAAVTTNRAPTTPPPTTPPPTTTPPTTPPPTTTPPTTPPPTTTPPTTPPPTTPPLTNTPIATTTRRPPPSSTTEYVPQEYDYQDNTGGNGDCEPISASLTSPKTGQKAWDKCVDYQEQLIYPCEKGVALIGDLARGNHCGHSGDELIVGGVEANLNEFPHMALLGFGELPSVEWQCGGALISEWFILTAGHCASSRDSGPVTYAVVGAHRRTDVDNSRRYRIKDIIKHPNYAPPKKYNDIMLLKTEKEISLGKFVVPACIHVGDQVDDSKVQATGWGLTTNNGNTANALQKVILNKFTHEKCASKYKSNRNLKQGIDDVTQICYGDENQSKDTCQGDSGGPIQIKSKKINCMYIIVGVTSFGKGCGFIGEPGIYTRVSHYLDWIEKEVWP